MMGCRVLAIESQLPDKRLSVGCISTLQKNRHMVSQRSPLVVNQVRTVDNDAIGNERPTDNGQFCVPFQCIFKRFKLHDATKTGLVISERFSAITGKGNEDCAHKFSMMRISHMGLN